MEARQGQPTQDQHLVSGRPAADQQWGRTNSFFLVLFGSSETPKGFKRYEPGAALTVSPLFHRKFATSHLCSTRHWSSVHYSLPLPHRHHLPLYAVNGGSIIRSALVSIFLPPLVRLSAFALPLSTRAPHTHNHRVPITPSSARRTDCELTMISTPSRPSLGGRTQSDSVDGKAADLDSVASTAAQDDTAVAAMTPARAEADASVSLKRSTTIATAPYLHRRVTRAGSGGSAGSALDRMHTHEHSKSGSGHSAPGLPRSPSFNSNSPTTTTAGFTPGGAVPEGFSYLARGHAILSQSSSVTSSLNRSTSMSSLSSSTSGQDIESKAGAAATAASPSPRMRHARIESPLLMQTSTRSKPQGLFKVPPSLQLGEQTQPVSPRTTSASSTSPTLAKPPSRRWLLKRAPARALDR